MTNTEPKRVAPKTIGTNSTADPMSQNETEAAQSAKQANASDVGGDPQQGESTTGLWEEEPCDCSKFRREPPEDKHVLMNDHHGNTYRCRSVSQKADF
jgi:hypothetical protein